VDLIHFLSEKFNPHRGLSPHSLQRHRWTHIITTKSLHHTMRSVSHALNLLVYIPHEILQTQPRLRQVAPYPAPSGDREEHRRKEMKNIPIISIYEAERVVGPDIHKYYGSKGRHIPNHLLWKTRKATGIESIKKTSKCIFCGSVCGGSAALYHARRHLNVNPYACPHKNW
jgi:hypothetical protein